MPGPGAAPTQPSRPQQRIQTSRMGHGARAVQGKTSHVAAVGLYNQHSVIDLQGGSVSKMVMKQMVEYGKVYSVSRGETIFQTSF